MCETSSFKRKGVNGADQVTWDTDGVSKTKVKRNCIYTLNYLIELFPTKVQVNSDATMHV